MNKTDIYRDCSDYYAKGVREDGVYKIQPGQVAKPTVWSFLSGSSSLDSFASSVTNQDQFEPVEVYCDMSEGGLTYLFRKHFKSNINFQVGIEGYKEGFGDIQDDFFIGMINFCIISLNFSSSN